jgi:methanogenic corrinoid protein MtbC1
MGVSESSLKRWCDAGLIETRRTAGGHRRIPVSAVVAFLRAQGFDAARPDLLGMPAGAHRDGRQVDEVAPRLLAALRAGAGDDVTSILFGLYLGGRSFADLADDLIAPAFTSIGHEWERGELHVYQEHRAVELVSRTLHALGRLLPAPPPRAPRALAATLSGDPYTLAIGLAELVLRERGWDASSLGPDHPADTLLAALRAEKPRLLALNLSSVTSPEQLVADLRTLHTAGVTIAVGGRALDDDLAARLAPARPCGSMRDLAALAGQLASPRP